MKSFKPVLLERYSWDASQHPRGQPENKGEFVDKEHANAWSNRKHKQDAMFFVGSKVVDGAETANPMAAELHPIDSEYLGDYDDNDNEKLMLLEIAKTLNENPREYIFRNIQTEFGGQDDAFGMTGTGNATETIRKASNLLLGSMSRHKHKVYYMTADGESRASLYKWMVSRVSKKSNGGYIGFQLEIPGHDAAFAVVNKDSSEAVAVIAKKRGLRMTLLEDN